MWTLAEFSKIETDILRKSIIDALLMEVSLFELLPWETIGQLSTGVVRVQDLPSIGFRRLNAGFDKTDIGHFEHKTENIALFGRDIDTDKAIARAKNTIADARAIQQTLALKSMAYVFNDKFINGNITLSDPLEFNGLKKRVDDIVAEGYTGQKVNCSCGGVGINNTATTALAYIDKLDELVYSVKGHNPEYLLMSAKCLLATRSALRRAGLLNTTQDMFGRTIDMYGTSRMVAIGTKADQVTEIITNTEDSSGDPGSSEHTSIYAVKFGVGDMLWGIQEYPLEAYDMGEIEEKPAYRTRIEWNLGLCDVDPRCVSRMYGVIPDASS